MNEFVIVLLFVLVFWLGYWVGRNTGRRQTLDKLQAEHHDTLRRLL